MTILIIFGIIVLVFVGKCYVDNIRAVCRRLNKDTTICILNCNIRTRQWRKAIYEKQIDKTIYFSGLKMRI
jgi:hypothetical protein